MSKLVVLTSAKTLILNRSMLHKSLLQREVTSKYDFMHIKKYCIILIILLFSVGVLHSQDRYTEICIDFRVNSIVIDSAYSNNAIRMQETIEFLRNTHQNSTMNIVCGTTSPEDNNPVIVPNTIVEPVIPEMEKWSRKLHIKTNALGLGLGIANAAVEVDICKHLSFTLPVYYSAWDYFKPTTKFRTLAVQPEFRYWFKPENEGWFLGAHYGLAYYNLAFDGDYRYQDHNRKTPSMGGGVTIGYRTHLSKNKRWKLEFSVGGGAYHLRYDKFHNTTDTQKGLMVTSNVEKMYYGVDQAAVFLSYAFNLKKKGGNR